MTTAPSRSMVQCWVLMSSVRGSRTGRVEQVPGGCFGAGGPITPYDRPVATDGVLYEAPVLRRLPLQLGVSVLIGFMVGGLIAILEGSPYTLGITIGIVVFIVVVFLTQALMPIRIEFRPGEVTLVSPRTSSKYRAESGLGSPGSERPRFASAAAAIQSRTSRRSGTRIPKPSAGPAKRRASGSTVTLRPGLLRRFRANGTFCARERRGRRACFVRELASLLLA